MISRVLYDKGYTQFVEASKQIKKDNPDYEFILIGDIDINNKNHVPKEIVEKDMKMGYINYLGYNNNVKELIRNVDCIVHPTFYNEGLSRVLMEALAMSKPIITTDIPGCKETVADGENGFLCKPKDINSLVKAINKFINLSSEERKEMGKKGREIAIKKFDVKNVIKIYNQILNNK